MNVIHTTTIHALCPSGGWDYYTVEFQPDPTKILETEVLEAYCDQVRGKTAYQEEILVELIQLIGREYHGRLEIRGRHGSNTDTVVKTRI